MKYLVLFFVLWLSAAGVIRPPLQKLQRLPLQKKQLIFKSPKNYEKRVLRYDEKTGQPISYDPKPEVSLLDAKSGKYALKWIGYDGKQKIVIYQRRDAIDVVVSASVSRTASGQYLYTYNVKNLASSGQHLSGFTVQTFASDVKPIQVNGIFIGQMSANLHQFNKGKWFDFGILSKYQETITPGRAIEFKLLSFAPPGLVECRVTGGISGIKGVGEDMPQELENILPGYNDWPGGYTIGPNANLKSLSTEERIQDLLAWLAQFNRLGWITSTTQRQYEQDLSRRGLEQVLNRAEHDLEAGNITSEVSAIIQAIGR